MRYDDPKVQEALASDYVVGALQGPARRRFETLMRSRPDLRRRVEAWEDRLTPLAEQTPARTPPPRVLRAIKQRIDPQNAASADAGRAGFWNSIAFWRPFGAVAAVMAVLVGGYAGFILSQPGPAPQIAAVTPTEVLPSYVAVLEDDAENPTLVVTAYRGPWRLSVKTLGSLDQSENQAYQIWTVERDSGTIRPLLQLTGGDPVGQPLDEAGWDAVKSSESLIVTLEAAGQAAASPSGPVLYSGPCINLWEASET